MGRIHYPIGSLGAWEINFLQSLFIRPVCRVAVSSRLPAAPVLRGRQLEVSQHTEFVCPPLCHPSLSRHFHFLSFSFLRHHTDTEIIFASPNLKHRRDVK